MSKTLNPEARPAQTSFPLKVPFSQAPVLDPFRRAILSKESKAAPFWLDAWRVFSHVSHRKSVFIIAWLIQNSMESCQCVCVCLSLRD